MFSEGLQMIRSRYLPRDLKWKVLQQYLTVKSRCKVKVKTIIAKLSVLDVMEVLATPLVSLLLLLVKKNTR